MKYKAAIYNRVSTSEQDATNQLLALSDWAECRGYEVVESYAETESAWRDGHEQELGRLLIDARKGKFDIVLVWALDRLSREGALAILTLVHRFRVYGVQVISYQETWTEAPGEIGEVLFALTGWVAEMESRRRSERTKAGLRRAVAQGKTLGRPPGSKDKRRRKKRSVKRPTFSALDFGPRGIS